MDAWNRVMLLRTVTIGFSVRRVEQGTLHVYMILIMGLKHLVLDPLQTQNTTMHFNLYDRSLKVGGRKLLFCKVFERFLWFVHNFVCWV